MSDLITLFVAAMIYSGYAVLFFGIFVMFLALLNKAKFRTYKLDPSYKPTFTFLTPAYNEEQFIRGTIKAFLRTSYPNSLKDMVIVNDGSTDRTREIVSRYATHIVDAATGRATPGRRKVTSRYPKITLVNKSGGGRGKAYAMNVGLPYVTGELTLITDGDIRIQSDIFEKSARHFSEPEVGAVVGYASIEKTGKSPLEGFIDFEFFSSQELNRRGFNVLGVHFIIPGGMSVFRSGIIEYMGGYPPDTLAEDTDLSFNIAMKSGKDVHYDTGVRVVSNEPMKLRDLWDQRVRWGRGNLQVTLKHRDKVGRPRYGRAATVVYPFWLAYIILPIAFLLSAGGIILDMTWSLDIAFPQAIKDLLIITFFGFWAFAAMLYRGRSALEGLLSPGIPVFSAFFSFLFFDEGIISLVSYMGFSQLSWYVGTVLGLWILLAIPGSYVSLWVSDRHQKLGMLLQLAVFGYWMFLITCVIHGYGKELARHENIWIKTRKPDP
ncbi:MAG: glycosyltransferase family 2 protein [Candidatus Aenigmarchaeota archaeon]|nr:glycosyltransferase family 2 protein [Candidatus Aenigmarchaeota archaeon]